MRTNGVLAFWLLGLVIAGLLAGIAADGLALPPKPVSLAMLFVGAAALGLGGGLRLRGWLAERTTTRLVAGGTQDQSLALRLLGDFPPYVIEAAEETAQSRDPAAVLLLMRAIQRLMARRPPGWREMAGAMVDALVGIGDCRPLPLLRQLRALPGAGEIRNLDAAIAALGRTFGLLRPASPPVEHLVLPSDGRAAMDSEALLRPYAGEDRSL